MMFRYVYSGARAVPVRGVCVHGRSRLYSSSSSLRHTLSSSVMIKSITAPSAPTTSLLPSSLTSTFLRTRPQWLRTKPLRSTSEVRSCKRFSTNNNGNNGTGKEMPEADASELLTYAMVEIDNLGNIVPSVTVSRAQLKNDFLLEARTVRMLDREHRQSPVLLVTGQCIFVCFNHIKAIITHDRTLLFDPRETMPVDQVWSRCKYFLRRAKREQSTKTGIYMPYEFVMLEFLLMHVTDALEQRYALLNQTVKELLQEARDTEGATLDLLLPIKYDISKFEIYLDEISVAIKNVLDNDEDMSRMYLSIMKTTGHKRMTELHSEIESLLEAYLLRVDEVENEIKRLIYNIRSTEKTIQIKLASVRNQIMKMELLLTISTFAVSCGALGTGVFGMNLLSGAEMHPFAFYMAVGAIGSAVIIIGRSAMRLCARNRITFFSKPIVRQIATLPSKQPVTTKKISKEF